MCVFVFFPVNILKKNEDQAFFENHEHVLLLMEKYLLIASPLAQLEEKQDTGGSTFSEQLGITGPGNMNLSDICTARNAADDRSNEGSELEVCFT